MLLKFSGARVEHGASELFDRLDKGAAAEESLALPAASHSVEALELPPTARTLNKVLVVELEEALPFRYTDQLGPESR